MDDKTSRLMVKKFSIARDTQRGPQGYMDEKREEGHRGDQEEKRGVKRGQTNLASNQFRKCSP